MLHHSKGRGAGVRRKDSSFCEQKEAKKPYPFACVPVARHACQWEKFFGSFFQKRTCFLTCLLQRDEHRMPHLPADRLGDVALAVGILHQQDLPGPDLAHLAVAGGDAHAGVEVDDVLAARGGVPVVVVGAGSLAKDDALGGNGIGQLPARPFLRPFHMDVAPVGLALVVDIDVVDAHGRVPPGFGASVPVGGAGGKVRIRVGGGAWGPWRRGGFGGSGSALRRPVNTS